ncbi:MAG: hypothetical protein ABL995_19420 [Bryobacteraceae bacterium]
MTTPVQNTNWSNDWTANLAGLAKPFSARTGTGMQPVKSLIQSFAAELSQILQSSTNGSQFEIGIVPASPNSTSSAAFKILVTNVTPGAPATPTSSTASSAPAADAATGNPKDSGTDASAGTAPSDAPDAPAGHKPCAPGDASDAPKLLPNGYPVGSEAFLAEFGPAEFGPPVTAGPTVLAPAKPVFYEPPPTQSIKGVKTVESVMQEELLLVQHGTSQMINGNWSLKYLTDSFRDQAEHVVAGQGNSPDPRIAPDNWQEIADQYSNMYLDWLTKTDASYWDPKLSGPVLDAATGQVQTSNGAVPAGVHLGSLSATQTTAS